VQEREFQERLHEHERLAEKVDKENLAALQRAKQHAAKLAENKKRIESQLEEAQARLARFQKETDQDLKAIKPDEGEVEKLAKLPVAQIASKMKNAIDGGDRDSISTLAAALKRNRDEALKYLMETISNSSDKSENYRYLLMLAMLRDTRALAFFQDLLQTETDAMIRRAAASALITVPDQSSVAVLIDVLRADKDWGVKTNAAAALGEIKDPRAVEPLKQTYLKEENYTLRTLTLGALARIADPGSVGFFSEIAEKSADGGFRLIAVNGLKNIGTPEAMAALQEVVSQQTGTVADEARRALEELSQEK
jgi:HEAT repeat protein